MLLSNSKNPPPLGVGSLKGRRTSLFREQFPCLRSRSLLLVLSGIKRSARSDRSVRLDGCTQIGYNRIRNGYALFCRTASLWRYAPRYSRSPLWSCRGTVLSARFGTTDGDCTWGRPTGTEEPDRCWTDLAG